MFAWIALGVFVAFMVLAGGVRTWIHWRRTGDLGERRAAAPGTPQKLATLVMGIAALATGVAAPIVELLGFPVLPLVGSSAVRGVGLVLAGLGALTTFAAQLAMGVSWRVGVDPGEQTTLVTTGPFRIVRNPIFSAVMIVFLGLTLAVPNPLSIAGLITVIAGIEVQVRRVEEPHLLATHDDAYRRYAARVGRFLPGLGRT